MKHRRKVWMGGLLVLVFLVAGCSRSTVTPTENNTSLNESADTLKTDPDYYIVESVSQDEGSMVLKNLTTAEEVKFIYSGGTSILNQYEKQISVSALENGTIVSVQYEKTSDGNKKLMTISMPEEIWDYDNVKNFTIDEEKQTMTVGEETFTIDNNCTVLSNETKISLSDLDSLDILTLRGTDSVIDSIAVTTGHGYIRLSNYQDYLDGWIEIGNTVIKKVEENMIIAIPEGENNIKISKENKVATGTIEVDRGAEENIDVSTLTEQPVESGKITFTITPADAVLTIDGEKTDYSKELTLEYGSYQLVVSADGYTTRSLTMVVQSESSNILIEMEAEDSSDDATDDSTDTSDTTTTSTDTSSTGTTTSSGTDSTSSASTNSTTSTSDTSSTTDTSGSTDSSSSETDETDESEDSTYKVYIYEPEGASVYLDGVYQGIIPVIFEKDSGSHTIKLTKSGYVTKSYTIEITDDDEDVNLVFPSLAEESE